MRVGIIKRGDSMPIIKNPILLKTITTIRGSQSRQKARNPSSQLGGKQIKLWRPIRHLDSIVRVCVRTQAKTANQTWLSFESNLSLNTNQSFYTVHWKEENKGGNSCSFYTDLQNSNRPILLFLILEVAREENKIGSLWNLVQSNELRSLPWAHSYYSKRGLLSLFLCVLYLTPLNSEQWLLGYFSPPARTNFYVLSKEEQKIYSSS